MSALWKQRVPLHPTFAPLNRCLEEDWFLLPFELKLERAYARALETARILLAFEHEELRGALVCRRGLVDPDRSADSDPQAGLRGAGAQRARRHVDAR